MTINILRQEGEKMEARDKIKLLESRLQILTARGKDNQGVCRRIQRDIRNLEKKI